jgi:DNA-binding MarR family transcriptional regulator
MAKILTSNGILRMNQQTETFLKLLREMQKIDPEFPLQYSICLTEISRDEGMSLSALSLKTGLALSTISRIVGALSNYRQSGAPYNLVRVKVSVDERRRKELYLTPRGKAVMDSIAELLKAA